jgi:hypothetical protein
MRTITCPKCNKVIVIPQGNDFVTCCNEVLYVLTGQNRDIFFDKLANPSKPNEALKNAAARHKKINNETHDNKDETTSGVS